MYVLEYSFVGDVRPPGAKSQHLKETPVNDSTESFCRFQQGWNMFNSRISVS